MRVLQVFFISTCFKMFFGATITMNSSIYIAIHIYIPPDSTLNVKTLILDILNDIKNEKNCTYSRFLIDTNNISHYILFMEWTSSLSFEKFYDKSPFKTKIKNITKLSTVNPTIMISAI